MSRIDTTLTVGIGRWTDVQLLQRFQKPPISGPRCFVPDFDGAFLSSDSKDALWDRFYTGAPQRQRRSVERSLRGLAKRYGVNPKTVAKWKARPT
jgi:hypothetical protein